MTTIHTRDAGQVDEYLCRLGEGDAVGLATICDEGTTATVEYYVRTRIPHEQMLDLLEETS